MGIDVRQAGLVTSLRADLTAERAKVAALVEALKFYANFRHWNDDGQCLTAPPLPAPVWAESDFDIVSGELDLGGAGRAALAKAGV